MQRANNPFRANICKKNSNSIDSNANRSIDRLIRPSHSTIVWLQNFVLPCICLLFLYLSHVHRSWNGQNRARVKHQLPQSGHLIPQPKQGVTIPKSCSLIYRLDHWSTKTSPKTATVNNSCSTWAHRIDTEKGGKEFEFCRDSQIGAKKVWF